ncbi:MAG: Rrf2 family transcriptional regulator [Proteobacteria bacterium]|nr:Rrf2 family transcriptional regulator [Pseudomonadota bacterium]MCP4918143.1 Rrf2 family transcriptional regulator [Pseudomonadota bacterium]
MNMLFSRTSEYAMRAVAHLAAQPTGERVSSGDLAGATQIPGHYLAKVMRRLVRAGLVDGRSGRSGGFCVARPPAEIRFRDVLDAMDDTPDEVRCVFGFDACDPDKPCALHAKWGPLRATYVAWASETTFAEVSLDDVLQPPD